VLTKYNETITKQPPPQANITLSLLVKAEQLHAVSKPVLELVSW